MVIPPAVLLGTTAECLNGGIRSKQPVPLEGLSFIGLWVMIVCLFGRALGYDSLFFGSATNFCFCWGGDSALQDGRYTASGL